MATPYVPSRHDSDNPTRRTFLQKAPSAALAATAAAVLPAGATLATVENDPGLARIEGGWRRWQAIHAERDRLDQMADDLLERADQAIAPMLPPEPQIPAELEPYSYWNEGMRQPLVGWGIVPRKGKVGKIARAHEVAEVEWRHTRNALLDGQPDYQTAQEIEAQREQLLLEGEEVRLEVLQIPTRSPRGLLIKLALTIDAKSFDDIDERFAKPNWYGTFDDLEPLLRPLLADLRAMVGAAA